MNDDRDPWYRDGLRFACTQCGHCCTGEPGNIWVSEEEIAILAREMGLEETLFRERYTVRRRKGISLRERSNNDCVFWSPGRGCQVYAQRPRQCRTWPFWRCNLGSPADWAEAGRECPGVDRGSLHTAQDIAAQAADDGLP